MDRKRLKSTAYDYGKIVVGAVIGAVGFQFFTYPNNIVAGGIMGLAQIMNMLLGTPVGVMTVVFNIPLFLFSWKRFGPRLIVGSLTALLANALAIDLFALMQLNITHDTLLGAVYGGVIKGFGWGLVYSAGATSGGIDIVAKFLRRRYPYVNFGTLLLTLDAVIIVAFAVIFRRYDSCMYAIIAMFIFGKVADLVLYGAANSNVCYVVTQKAEAVAQAITHQLHHGVTYLHGQGAWTGETREVVFTVIKRNQIVELKRLVRKEDDMAFVVVTHSNEVFGKGFANIADLD